MSRVGAVTAAGLLAYVLPMMLPAGAAGLRPPASGPCQGTTFAETSFTVCTVDLQRYAVRLFWKGPDGQPYGSYAALSRTSPSGLAFAMNAGMFHPDLSPVGLYVEDGRELKKASTADGPGNFHLKPNGIFFVSGRTAGVLETGAYLRRGMKADYATQSGPMLVVDGRIHPKISGEGTSRKMRNGVGVRDGGRVAIFAISDQPVTFHTFARLFRDHLRSRNALFLDGGTVPSLYAPHLGREDVAWQIGPIVGASVR